MLAIQDKQVLVLGLGDTGLSALRWLRRQGARLSVADSREAPPNLDRIQTEMPELVIYTGAFDESAFANQELIVISPGVPLAEPEVQKAIQRGIPVVGDVELFAQHRPQSAKVIAITGSNGKSTVTTLVGEMCKTAGLNTVVAGNIGLPVLSTLDGSEPDVYVLELSSFQLETTSSLNADVATVLNLSEDHLDRYDGMPGYAAAKARVFMGHGEQVLNRDDSWSMQMAIAGRHQHSFGLDHLQGQYGLKTDAGKTWLMDGDQPLIATSEMHIAGLHNAANALASIALCRAIGIEMASLLTTLRNFKGLPHRVEWVADLAGVAYYDDSKGTNVGATCAALAGLVNPQSTQKVVLIAGGDGKGQDFSPLAEPVARNARAVVLIGRDGPLIEQALIATDVPMYRAEDMREAVVISQRVAKPGDAVLLSPACASFDMFRNYLHRAEVFIAAVQQLEVAA